MKYILLVVLILSAQICSAEKFTVTEAERELFYENKGFSLYRANGEMAGYKITDFTNEKYYKAVGLNVGDIVTHINGYDLRIVKQIRMALPVMKSGETLEFTFVDELGGAPKKALIEFNIVKKK